MKKLFLISFILFLYSGVQAQKTVQLQEGSVVRVRLLETLDSKNAKVGDQVNLEVSDDVMADDKVAIRHSERVSGTITQVQPAKMMGKKGMLDFTIDYVKSVNGKNIRIRSSQSTSGKNKTGGVVAAAVIINPLLIFIKGKDVVIEKGKEFTTYVDKDYDLALK